MERIALALTPTPLEYLPRVSERLGVEMWVKRDDLTGDLVTGGNKVRKLEYILADAKAKGADTVLTTGGPQSNHAKITAALAIRLGLHPVLVLGGREPEARTANLFLNTVMGVDVRFSGAHLPQEMDQALQDTARVLQEHGRRPYVIPVGGSNGLGGLGYVDAYLEMEEQRKTLDICFDWEFVTAGSGGTYAGVYLGHALSGSASRLVGASPWLRQQDIMARIESCIQEAVLLLEMKTEVPLLNEKTDARGKIIEHRLDAHRLNHAIDIDDSFIGGGYGKATKEGIDAIRLFASHEALMLDHVYTGKTMACLLDYVRRGIVRRGQTVLFWHTGGAPGLFAIEEQWTRLL